MRKIFKNIIYLAIIIILTIIFVFFVYKNFFNNENSEEIKITKLENQYNTSQDIVLSGTSKSEIEIMVLFNNKFGITESDKNGKWAINLGRAFEGKYAVNLLADDSPTSRSIETAQLAVFSNIKKVSLIDGISNFMTAGISAVTNKNPEKLIMISTEVPPVLKGNWKLIK